VLIVVFAGMRKEATAGDELSSSSDASDNETLLCAGLSEACLKLRGLCTRLYVFISHVLVCTYLHERLH
jgi:hypothetical protein